MHGREREDLVRSPLFVLRGLTVHRSTPCQPTIKRINTCLTQIGSLRSCTTFACVHVDTYIYHYSSRKVVMQSIDWMETIEIDTRGGKDLTSELLSHAVAQCLGAIYDLNDKSPTWHLLDQCLARYTGTAIVFDIRGRHGALFFEGRRAREAKGRYIGVGYLLTFFGIFHTRTGYVCLSACVEPWLRYDERRT